MSFKKHIVHVIWFLVPDVAFNQSTKCCICPLAVVHQTWALLVEGPSSPVHDDVQYTCTVVIIGGLLHAYHMHRIGLFQGVSDDLAKHKASNLKYLESRYWTPTFKAY